MDVDGAIIFPLMLVVIFGGLLTLGLALGKMPARGGVWPEREKSPVVFWIGAGIYGAGLLGGLIWAASMVNW